MTVTQSYTFHRFERFWMGTEPAVIEGGEDQHTYDVAMEYGWRRRVALDMRAGFSATRSLMLGSDSGVVDTSFGVRWQPLEELEDEAPATVALRLGGIIPGGYSVGFPGAIGDGAPGIELSVSAGRSFSGAAWGLYGESGYRVRTRKVPADAFGSVGFYRNGFAGTAFAAGLSHSRGLSGIDIGAPGFSEGRFPETREILTAVESSFSWTHLGGRRLDVTWAHVLAGRNTGKRSVLSVGYSVALGPRVGS